MAKRWNRWRAQFAALLIAAAAAFALSGIVLEAHAAKYGDGPHEHNGKLCVLSLVAAGAHKVIETAPLVIVAVFTVWRAADQSAQTERALIAVRAARPRGPPCL